MTEDRTPRESTVVQRLRAAVESSPSGLIMIDGGGRMVLVNREVERLFGYSREELLGRQVEMLVPDRFQGGHPGFRDTFMATPTVRQMGAGRDLFGRRRDGSEVPIEIGLTPVATEEGMFVISSIVDVTQRKRAEAHFRIAVESSPNGMLMMDARGAIVLVNREVERMFGYARDELLGQTIEVLVPQRFRAGHPGSREKFFAAPQKRSMGAGRELFGVRKDGTEIPVEIGLNPIETDEEAFVLGSIVDISSRKRVEANLVEAEEQLRQGQKMEAVGRLAGGIAHDFNNLLMAILSFGTFARDSLTVGDPARADVEEVIKAAERAAALTRQLLAFSRQQMIQPRILSVNGLVEDTDKMLRRILGEDLDLETHTDPHLWLTKIDPGHFEQVLVNLAVNARDAMPKGGMLTIETRNVILDSEYARQHAGVAPGEYVMLAVTDNGTGMSEAVRSRIFEPFFTTKPKSKGTGLGLSTCYGIVTQAGGHIWVYSEQGRGTTFKIYLPRASEGRTPALPEEAELPVSARGSVLVVEDEDAVRAVAVRVLRRAGFDVRDARNAEDALAACSEEGSHFDVLLTDVVMPGMSGRVLAEKVAAIVPGIHVVYMSGYTDNAIVHHGVIDADMAFLQKPFSPDVLVKKVQQVLLGPG